jgi:Rrf2 family protein
MFQISRRADYAVRIMIALGMQPQRELMPSRELSRQTGVPKAFLHKISADLLKAGLVRTASGPSGGISLARPSEKINMRHILEAVEGPICFNICLRHPGECPRERICPSHDFWGRVQTTVIRQLEAATLDGLVREAIALRQRPRAEHDQTIYLYSD